MLTAPVCPRCSRPVAVARASCLYCGAPLAVEQVAAAAAPAQPPTPDPALPPPERHIVVLRLQGVAADALAAALGISAFEAEQRLRRGGYQLQRIADPDTARREEERLRAAGLAVVVVPEAEARLAADPQLAMGGSWETGALALRTGGGPRRIAAQDVLLMVRGPIARALEPPQQFKRVRLAGPGEGHRVHLHLRQEQRPVEVDPESFELGPAAGPGSSLVKLLGWLDELARGVTVDEGFRHLAPALGPALAPAAGAARVLAPSPTDKAQRPALFDNVGQFRFYSGWRAAAERRLTR